MRFYGPKTFLTGNDRGNFHVVVSKFSNLVNPATLYLVDGLKYLWLFTPNYFKIGLPQDYFGITWNFFRTWFIKIHKGL